MKLTIDNRRLTFMSLFLATALLASANVQAQYDDLSDAEDALSNGDALEMDQIDIDGKLSPSELLKRRREKLEERNKIMVEKKIEDIRVKQEIALTNKLQGAFNNSLNNINEDKVQVTQAAPVVAPAPVAPAPIIETRIIEVPAEPVVEIKNSKIIPMLGTSSIKGDRIDLESNLTLGVSAETIVMPQVSVGLGIGYTSLDLTDVSNDFVSTGYGSYNPGYYGVYGSGRKMSLNKLSIEANSKYFFTDDARIKPFIGLALAMNRSTLKYEDQTSYNTNGVNFGNEGYSSTALATTVKLGAEIDISNTIGFNVDLSYSKNLTSGISKSAQTVSSNPDQGRLENITKEIETGDTTAIQAGLVIRF